MKTSAALSKQADFALYIGKAHLPFSVLFREYNIDTPFRVEEMGLSRARPQSFWMARRYRALIQKSDPATIWYTRDVLLAFWLTFFCQAFRQRYVFELHTLARFPRLIYRRVLSHARCIITTNERKKKDIETIFGISTDKILVAGNGIDLAEFAALPSQEEARKQLGLTISKPLIVYAGTDAKEYGTGVLRNVQNILQTDAEILIVSGESRNRALLHMAAADILVAPYLDANEHFRHYMSPMKIKEYMAMGRPIIASDLPAVREILDDSSAFFAEPGNAQSLAEAIRLAVKNPAEADTRRDLAHKQAESFVWDRRASDILDFIEKHSANV